jgi:hypothetical protein
VDFIVKRGATMPVFQRKTYRTTRAVSPREQSADPVRLLFVEGESSVPGRNLTVGQIFIEAHEITRPLPSNSEVEVSIRWDQGEDPKASAYVPFLDQQFESVLTMQNKSLPDVAELERQVDELREKLGTSVDSSETRAKRLHEIEVRLVDARQGDTAAAHSAAAQIGPLLDEMEADASGDLLASSKQRLQDAEAWATAIAQKFGTAEDQHTLSALIREARGAAETGTHRDVDYRCDRIVVHTYGVLAKQPGFWLEEFSEMVDKAASATDPVQAGSLISRGRDAIDRQDHEELARVVRNLWQLFPESAGTVSFGLRASSSGR